MTIAHLDISMDQMWSMGERDDENEWTRQRTQWMFFVYSTLESIITLNFFSKNYVRCWIQFLLSMCSPLGLLIMILK